MKLVILLLLVGVAIAARPKSDCEKHRDSTEGTQGIMKLIVDCEDNGDYKPRQCYQNSNFCVCYDKKGHPASPISTQIEDCKCFLRQKEKIDRGHDNPYIPQCEPNGSFSKKQCYDYNKSCWCVDEDGNQVGKIYSEGADFDCE